MNIRSAHSSSSSNHTMTQNNLTNRSGKQLNIHINNNIILTTKTNTADNTNAKKKTTDQQAL